jgi:hypothetical protein
MDPHTYVSSPKRALEHLRKHGWVSLAQFAKLVGISYQSALNYRILGRVESIQVGHIYRVYIKSIRKFLHAQAERNKPKSVAVSEILPPRHIYANQIDGVFVERVRLGLESDDADPNSDIDPDDLPFDE